MKTNMISEQQISRFHKYLVCEEKSPATVEKYLRDVRAFFVFLGKQNITKERVIEYKKQLQGKGYTIRSINSMLAGINHFLGFVGHPECKVKTIRMQKEIYCDSEKELTKAEYMRLLGAAEGKQQIKLVIQTICATGIRVSELKFFTVESVQNDSVTVRCKCKTRPIFIPKSLKGLLLGFAKQRNIKSGPIFITRGKKPLDRSYIWTQMKKLCVKANVVTEKVFPHNLRKLFARTFYSMQKDIAKLSDLLGHSSIETTKIYIMTSGHEHRKQIEQLGLVIREEEKEKST